MTNGKESLLRAFTRGLVRVLVVAAVLAALVAAARAELADPLAVKELVLGFGPFAPLVWAVLYLGAVFVPYATTVMTMAAGLAFGTVRGSMLTYGLTPFASLLPFAVSRRLGRAGIEGALGNTRVQKYVDLVNRHAFLVFFYLRLLPTVPYEVQNYIAGVTRISYRQFLLASFLGNGPMLFILAFLGDSVSDPTSPRFRVAAALYLAALLLPVFLSLARRRFRQSLFFEGLDP